MVYDNKTNYADMKIEIPIDNPCTTCGHSKTRHEHYTTEWDAQGNKLYEGLKTSDCFKVISITPEYVDDVDANGKFIKRAISIIGTCKCERYVQ